MPELGYRDTSSSSHELPMESRAKVEPGSGTHSVYTHFPKDPNCDICLKTEITGVSCRRRSAQSGKIGDLITADHTILSEGSESRINHRYAVVVQDLATELQSCPCKTKTSQETQKSLMKFLEPTRKPKIIYTDNSLEFGKSGEELSLNHCTSTPHRSETKMAEREKCNTANCVPFVVPGVLTSSSSSSSPTSPTSSPTEHQALTRSESMSEEVQGNLSHGPAETENPNKNDDNEEVRGNLSHGLPEWPQEVRHGLVDESVPERREASRSSHELPSGPRAKVVSGKPKKGGDKKEVAVVKSARQLEWRNTRTLSCQNLYLKRGSTKKIRRGSGMVCRRESTTLGGWA